MSEVRAAGTIYDLGYQRYTGSRLGRLHSIQALLSHSFRTAFGIQRGSRAKLVPIIVAAVVFFQAVVQIAVAAAMGTPAFINSARHLEFSAFLLALFAAAQAPELVVTDRQQGVLSLYLSRPLTGTDYALAKLGAMISAMVVITMVPELMLFGGKIAVAIEPWAAFKGEWRKLGPIIGGTFLTACMLGAIGLALSSMAGKRAYASASVIAFFLLLPAASELIRNVATGDVKRYAILANPTLLIIGFLNWLFDIEARRRTAIGRADLPGSTYLYVMLAVTAVCVAVLILRYRKSEA
jgi:ABC-2 type transport system permease protein